MMYNTLEVDLANVKSNIEFLRDQKDVCLMVKGNAYGVGEEIITKLIEMGYNYFGVSTVKEALDLRKIDDTINILLVSYFEKDELFQLIQNRIEITIYDFEVLEQVSSDAIFHLKFDTGMGRIGFFEEQVLKVKEILNQKQLSPYGIYTHLANATNKEKSQKQIQAFQRILSHFDCEKIKYIHIHNSLGAQKYQTNFDNLVRIGMGMWGLFANKNEYLPGLKEALTLKLVISQVKTYQGPVGYGSLDNVSGELATVACGYHDGIGNAFHHYQIPDFGMIVGKVCMCQFMVLLNENVEVKRTETFEFFGKSRSIYEIVDYTGLSTYEFLSKLSNRIKRKYI